MAQQRLCSRTACGRPAVATLTYVYADSTAVLGPLAIHAEPHCYDLCTEHAQRLTAPRGWEVVRLATDTGADNLPSDDLSALADVVREGRMEMAVARTLPADDGHPEEVGSGRRGHLRVLRDPS